MEKMEMETEAKHNYALFSVGQVKCILICLVMYRLLPSWLPLDFLEAKGHVHSISFNNELISTK